LETEFAFSSEANDRDDPDGVDLDPNRGTALAWDNYDVNMDTIDGKDTLHATVGICYQNMQDATNPNQLDNVSAVTGIRSGRNRRQFDGKERDIDPYYKQLKKARFDLSPSNTHQERENVTALHVIDFYWLLKSEVDKPLPLFPGFYSRYINDQLPLQRIWYMDPISAPPTRNNEKEHECSH
jgi:hypothetical protein